MADIREIVGDLALNSKEVFPEDTYLRLDYCADGEMLATVDGQVNLAAIAPAIEQAGYAIVPVEPTKEMLWAFEDRMGMKLLCLDEGYKAMLTAAKEGK